MARLLLEGRLKLLQLVDDAVIDRLREDSKGRSRIKLRL